MQYKKRWEIVGEPLGKGGQGVVYRVRDKRLVRGSEKLEQDIGAAIRGIVGSGYPEQRKQAFNDFRACIQEIQKGDQPENLAALKVLHKPEDAPHPEYAEERIRREIAAMVKAGDHPNLLRILEADPDAKWYVSEYHPNGHIHTQPNVERFKGDFPAALKAIRPIVAAVAELHNDQMVHRDIKPQNILVADDGRLVLGDFGLVFFADAEHTRLTETLETVGSWQWMPQWAMGMRVEDVRPTFDVHCFGKTLWSMVSGEPYLQLWYFAKEQFDVSKKFSDSPFIELANPLFEKCITEEETDCLSDANALLREIDIVLQMISRGGEILSDKIARPCRICGRGTYKLSADHQNHEIEEFGLRPTGSHSFKLFTCNSCGHAQLFSFDGTSSRPAWEK